MRRISGVVALLAGAVLTAAASNRTLYETEQVGGKYRLGYRTTMWGTEYKSSNGTLDLEPTRTLYGVPAVVAAVLLVIVAVLVLASPRLPARVALAVRVGAVVAAALLAGSVWAMGQLVLASSSQSDLAGGTVANVAGPGTWLLVAAAVVAVAGALLVQQRPVYQLPDDDDTDTPPMGIPIHPSVSTEESSPG